MSMGTQYYIIILASATGHRFQCPGLADRGRRKISGRNSRTILNPAVAPKETPALRAILSAPFQLPGPQMLAIALAPTTPVTLETEKRWLPSGCRAVKVLKTAWPVRA